MRQGVQGDIESVAAKSPKELTTLFEHISGSEAFRADYNKLSAAKEVCGPRTLPCNISSSAAHVRPTGALGTICTAFRRMYCFLCNSKLGHDGALRHLPPST